MFGAPNRDRGASVGAPVHRIRLVTPLSLTLALTALIALVVWQGVATVLEALTRGGWSVLWIGAVFVLPHALHTTAWRTLAPGGNGVGWPAYAFANWLGFGVNWLLPVARVGGDLVKARALSRLGAPPGGALSSVVVHKTLEPLTLVGYALLGLLTLGVTAGGGRPALTAGIASAVLAAAVLLLAFVRLQHRGMLTRLTGFAEHFLPVHARWSTTARAADAELPRIYARRRRLAGATACLLGYRALLTAEIYLAAQLLGQPIGLLDALVLDSLAQAARSVAFFLPGGLGAQEGGFAGLALLLHLDPALALALSLLRRVRELEVGVPALLAWQWLERRGARTPAPR